mgnify:CR=1 FL=1
MVYGIRKLWHLWQMRPRAEWIITPCGVVAGWNDKKAAEAIAGRMSAMPYTYRYYEQAGEPRQLFVVLPLPDYMAENAVRDACGVDDCGAPCVFSKSGLEKAIEFYTQADAPACP